eukprot:gene175-biopygen13594
MSLNSAQIAALIVDRELAAGWAMESDSDGERCTLRTAPSDSAPPAPASPPPPRRGAAAPAADACHAAAMRVPRLVELHAHRGGPWLLDDETGWRNRWRVAVVARPVTLHGPVPPSEVGAQHADRTKK